MGQTQIVGKHGEDIALRFLLERGYVFVAQNVATLYGELDLVMREGNELVFVEVKYRENADAFGGPEAALTPRKLLRVKRALLVYLARINWQSAYRLDFLAIDETDGGPLVKHFQAIEV